MSASAEIAVPRSRTRRFPKPISLHSWTLNRYLIVELFPPLSLGLFVVTCTLLLITIVDVLDQLFLSGAPVWPIVKLLICVFPMLLTTALPIGCLLSSMLVYGRLMEDRELTAMRAAGMSGISLLLPSYLLGVALTFFNLYWTSNVVPKALDILAGTTQEIVEQMTSINFFKPGQFNSMEDLALYFTGMPPGTNTLQNLTIFKSSAAEGMNWLGDAESDKEASNWTVSAPTAEFVSLPTQGVMQLILHNCISEDLRPDKVSRVQIDRATLTIDIASRISKMTGGGLTRQTDSVSHYRQIADRSIDYFYRTAEQMGLSRESSNEEIIGRSEELIEQEEQDPGFLMRTGAPYNIAALEEVHASAQRAQVNLNRAMQRFTYPVGTLLFMMVGCPLGMLTGRGKKTTCLLITIGVLLVYYTLEKTAESYAESLALTSHFDPGWIVWIPNVLVLALALFLTNLVCRH
jgi:lipopolysaccharide export LptBFGC system permease protein LptF